MGFEIINKIKKEKGLTNAQIASMAGITLSTLDKITAGINTNPKLDTLQSICKVLGCTLNDFDDNFNSHNIYTVDEQSLINKYRTLDTFGQDTVKAVLDCESKRCLSQKEMNDLLSDYNIIYLPMPIQPASAGTGEFADDETVERVPVLRNVWTSKADYALRVHGDSMEPDMHEDDFILVRAQPAVELGEIGIFIHDNERYVKVFRGDRLESLNDAYEDIPFSEDTRCIGKVIGVLKPEWIAK